MTEENGSAERSRPTICLVMIVRDEAHIVTETLESLLPHIDTWSIVDTGSSDDTVDVVRSFFAATGIDGVLHERRWVDFGHNRTEALDLARDRADYSLMMDADDLLHGEPDFSSLTADAYMLRIGSDVTYWRTQLFRTDRAWEYRGVVHEYATCREPHGPIERLGGDHHVESRRLGARNLVADKYERDSALLTAALERDPDDSRSVFYLAQSRMDAGDPAAAYELYTRRTTMGGWPEEIYWSHVQRARALERMGEPWERVLAAHLEAWNSRPTRNESLVEIARHHRSTDEWHLAHLFASRAAEVGFPEQDLLFVSSDSHRWQSLDELAIASFYIGRQRESWDLNDRLLNEGHLPVEERERVLSNRDFSAPTILAEPVPHPIEVIDRLSARFRRGSNRDASATTVTCTITTCRRLDLFITTMDSFLSHCIDVDRIDRWICIDDGSSGADREAMARRYPFMEFVWKGTSDAGHPRSMEMLLDLVDSPYWLHLEDDWRFVSRLPYVEQSIAVLDDDPAIGQVLFNRNFAEELRHRDVSGGVVRQTSGSRVAHRVHVSDSDPESDDRGPHSYWPHFSLRPSLVRTDVVRVAGGFDTTNEHFELDLARRVAATGHRCSFLDSITCLHIGPLTSERGALRRANAYDLNEQAQFGHLRSTTVRLIGNWATPHQLREHFDRQTSGDGRWRSIRLVEDPNADVTVVLNHPGPELVDPRTTIVVPMEPRVGARTWDAWADPDPRAFLQVRRHPTHPNPAEWHLGATWSELHSVRPHKSRDLSIVVSSKRTDPGQRWRLDLLRDLVDHDVAIDVFGRDPIDGVDDHSGSLPDHDKRNGLYPYRYTIAVENNFEDGYVTEKLYDAVLSECLCFYRGAPNAMTILDPDAWIELPDDIAAAREVIVDSIERDLWAERLPAIRRAKERILDELQLLPVIERAIIGARRWNDMDVRVLNLDRRPDRWSSLTEHLVEVLGPEHASRVERVAATDGMDIAVTQEIEHLFRGNDFDLRRGIVGCAMSHLDLWRSHMSSESELLLVLEDDVRLVEDFRGRMIDSLGALADLEFDLAHLGYVRWLNLPERESAPPGEVWRSMRWDEYLGGCFAYLLTRRGARRLVEIADRDGVQTGIDWFPMRHQHELRSIEHVPFLAHAELAWPGRSGDSDIQHDFVSARTNESGRPIESTGSD